MNMNINHNIMPMNVSPDDTHRWQTIAECSTAPSQFTLYPNYARNNQNSKSIHKKRNKKRVTFKPTCTVRTHTPNILTKEDKSRLYYSKHELKIQSLEAYAICTLSQELPSLKNSGTLLLDTTMPSEPSSDGGVNSLPTPYGDGKQSQHEDSSVIDTLRGLELIIFPKRKSNKVLAQRSLLKYQALLTNKHPNVPPEWKALAIAKASSKLNLWSKLVALETGRLDAYRAYEADYLVPVAEPLPPELNVNAVSPFPFYCKKKRKQGEMHPGARARAGSEGDASISGDVVPSKKRRTI